MNSVCALLTSKKAVTIASAADAGSFNAPPNPLASVEKPLAAICSLLNFSPPSAVDLAIARISAAESLIASWNIPDLIPNLSINAPVPPTNAPVTPVSLDISFS